MPVEQFVNNAQTTLNGAINNSVTSLVVTSATGFPTVGNFRLLIDSEIMLVTAVSGTTFTITRGIEGTTAASHSSGAPVTHILTADALKNIITVEQYFLALAGGASSSAQTRVSDPDFKAIVTVRERLLQGGSLVGWWKFDEGSGTNAADSSGFVNNATISNGSWAAGKLGQALNCNGSNTIATISYASALAIGTGNFSVAAWIKTSTTGAHQMIFAKYGGAIIFRVSTDGKILFYTYDGSNQSYRESSVTVNDGNWHLIVGVRNGTTMNVYIDGSIDNGSVLDQGVLNISGSNSLYIGNVDYGVPFNGLIDNVMFFNGRALSAGDVTALWNGGAGGDIPTKVKPLDVSEMTYVASTTDITFTNASGRPINLLANVHTP
jgi:hypothetical protein